MRLGLGPTGYEQAARLALAAAPGPLVLCGYSLGARVALAAALRAPDRVAGLMLVSVTPASRTPGARGARRRRRGARREHRAARRRAVRRAVERPADVRRRDARRSTSAPGRSCSLSGPPTLARRCASLGPGASPRLGSARGPRGPARRPGGRAATVPTRAMPTPRQLDGRQRARCCPAGTAAPRDPAALARELGALGAESR